MRKFYKIAIILFIILFLIRYQRIVVQRGNPANWSIDESFGIDDICNFLEIEKEQLLILTEEDFKLEIALSQPADSGYEQYYRNLLIEQGFWIGDSWGETISSTQLLHRQDVQILMTAISDIGLYQEHHRDENPNLEKLSVENLLFSITWGGTHYPVVNRFSGVSMSLKTNTLSSGGGTFIVQNTSGMECIFGEAYCVERNENDEWIPVSFITGGLPVWNAIAYEVSGNGFEKEFKISWESMCGELTKGKYRIVKEFFVKDLYNSRYYVAAEFIIE